MIDIVGVLAEAKAVPVIRAANRQDSVHMAEAMARGGLNVVEATFTTPGVVDAIKEMVDLGITVGAGTILNERQARAAAEAGASFLVTPVWRPWLFDVAGELDVPAVPGAATPTEIWNAVEGGAKVTKVFPICRLGGARYIHDLLGPFPELRLMATGGATLETAIELLEAGCLAVGLGSIGSDSSLGVSVEERARTVAVRLRQRVGAHTKCQD
jgi:2-dehydro-3-deoxyphosphogluconate aldolase / (4S)-4-hydroxy-2-oxoglutarate aldolase